jgi:hypothetical protein
MIFITFDKQRFVGHLESKKNAAAEMVNFTFLPSKHRIALANRACNSWQESGHSDRFVRDS